MSTIATPRDPSSLRRNNSFVGTPTSSARPSLDIPLSRPGSRTSSPNPGRSGSIPPLPSKRTNRAALREFYKLKNTPAPPLLEVTDTDSVSGDGPESSYSEVPLSEIDVEGFDADAFVKAKLKDTSLGELLKTYTRVLGEIRALDAEKKALVYDNYSKLITATETIRKMRENMDPLNPMASTLDPAIAQIYSQASSIREAMRQTAPKPEDTAKIEAERARKRRTRELVTEVLGTPGRIRALVEDGKIEEAEEAWRLPKRLLLKWKEKGVGGRDIDACLAQGEAALKGEDAAERA